MKLPNFSEGKRENQGLILFNYKCHNSSGIRLFAAYIWITPCYTKEPKPGSELVRGILWCYLEQIWEINSEPATGQMLSMAKCNPVLYLSGKSHKSIASGRWVQNSRAPHQLRGLMDRDKVEMQTHSDMAYLHFCWHKLCCQSSALAGLAISTCAEEQVLKPRQAWSPEVPWMSLLASGLGWGCPSQQISCTHTASPSTSPPQGPHTFLPLIPVKGSALK